MQSKSASRGLDAAVLARRLQALGPGVSDELKRLLAFYNQTGDPRLGAVIDQAIRDFEVALAVGTRDRHHPVALDALAGDALVGCTVVGGKAVRVGLTEAELVRGVNIAGMRGVGKTTLLRLLAFQLSSYWAFDHKDDFAGLCALQPGALVIDVPVSLRIALFREPEGCSWEDWRGKLVEVLAKDSQLMVGARGFLLEQVQGFMDRYGPVTPGTPRPTLRDFGDYLSHAPVRFSGPTRDYYERVKNRITALSLEAGTAFDCSQDYLAELMDRQVIFRFSPGVPEETRVFITNLLLARKLLIRTGRGERGGRLRSACIIDEAHKICDRSLEDQVAGRPSFLQLLLDAREYGEGIITVCQNPAQFSPVTLGNTQVRIAFRLGLAEDAEVIAQAQGLSREQAAGYLHLPNGCAMLFKPQLEEPVTVIIPPLGFPDVGRDVLSARLDAFLSRIGYSPGASAVPAMPSAAMTEQADRKGGRQVTVAERTKDFLMAAVLKPYSLASELQSELKLGGGAFQTVLRELRAHADLAVLHAVETGRKGKPPCWVEIGDGGYALVNRARQPETGKGGGLHRFWQHRVKRALEARHFKEVLIEHSVNGKSMDVWAVAPGGERRAYEVQLGLDNVLDNVRRDFELAAVDGVTILVTSTHAVRTVQEKLQAVEKGQQERVAVEILGNYLDPAQGGQA